MSFITGRGEPASLVCDYLRAPSICCLSLRSMCRMSNTPRMATYTVMVEYHSKHVDVSSHQNQCSSITRLLP